MKQNRKKRKAESSANGDRPVKHAINPELRIMLASTALIFLLLLLTMVISNTLVMLGVRFGIITAKRPGSPLLPFLIQSGIIKEFNAGEQVRESILMLEQKWNQKKISFDLEIEEVSLTGNRSLLRQVWVNLIDNAVKFSPERATVSISVNENCGNFVFTIKDHGPGMNAGTIERIFDKFYQGTHPMQQKGTDWDFLWRKGS